MDGSGDDQGDAEGGGFFLEAAGIGDNEGRTLEEGDKGEIVERGDQVDVRPVAKTPAYLVLDVRIGVHRQNKMRVLETVG